MGKVRSPQYITRMRIVIFISVWLFTAWLLMPLITLEKVELRSSLEYFYRASAGVVIMIILFGKTVTDLLFSQDLSRKKSVLYVTFLTVYSLVLAGGIIFMAVRILLVFLNTSSAFQPQTPDIQY
ncbi:MAG: hypothetical protein NTU60_02210 [Candidatus Aminicenantes bacterium]|nr:hypothetical protein [Candidatus Aminicenantes bacterium]